jgi:hypothetical protein
MLGFTFGHDPQRPFRPDKQLRDVEPSGGFT